MTGSKCWWLKGELQFVFDVLMYDPLFSASLYPIRVVEQGNNHVILYHEYSGVQHSMLLYSVENISVSSIMKLTMWYSVKSHGNHLVLLPWKVEVNRLKQGTKWRWFNPRHCAIKYCDENCPNWRKSEFFFKGLFICLFVVLFLILFLYRFVLLYLTNAYAASYTH